MTERGLCQAKFLAKPSSGLGSRSWAGRRMPALGPNLLSFRFFSAGKWKETV